MAKPYVIENEIGDELAAQFVHGTDTEMTLDSAAEFDSGGGYIRVYVDAIGGAWALYEYTAIAGNVLTVTPCTLGDVESGAAYTFPIGSPVERVWMAEDVADLRADHVAKTLYDAHSIVASVADNTPANVTVAEQTLVGRITAGNIDDLSVTQVRTLLNVADGADVTGSNAPQAHKDSHDPEDGGDALDCAAPSELSGVQAAAEGSAHTFARSDHTHQIQHSIADNHIVTVDDADAATGEFVKFTANGVEGRAVADVRSDLNVADGADVTGSNAPQAHKDLHDPEDGSDALDCAAAGEIVGVADAAEGSAHSFARSDHVHQIQHSIADNHIVTIDDADAATGEFVKFTSDGVEGRAVADVRSDLNVADGADVTGSNAPQAHKDSHDPEDGSDALDCAAAGEVVGVADAAEGSAHSFARSDHTHQIQHSIADNHVVTIDDADAATGQFAKFTANGIEGRAVADVRSDLNVEDGADVTDATNVASAGAVMDADFNAKGDILSASANDTPLILTVGANDTVLTADSGEASGLKWAAAAGGDVVDDTTPQLGGDLDLNDNYIELMNEPTSDATGSGIIITATIDSESGPDIGDAMMLYASGEYGKADASATTTAPCTAIALETGTGAGKKLLLKGIMRLDSWDWTTGPGVAGLIYLSASIGDFTQTKPSGSTDVIQVVGYAISDDTMYFDPQGVTNLVDDTTPQLGGDLDFNTFSAQLDPTLGSDHTYSGLITSENVGESVVFGNLLYFDCSEVEWKLADADQIGTMPAQGIALETKGNGEACKILLYGYIRDDSWGWTIDDTKKVLYASVTAGGISETAVAADGDFSQVVGMIRTADTMFFNPSLVLTEYA